MSKNVKDNAASDTSLIRIKHVKFTRVGMTLCSPREALDQLPHREPSALSGYDISLDPARGAFRFDYYVSGEFRSRKWMPMASVEHYEEADQPPSSAA